LRDRGVAPNYAARLCRELLDHYEDIEAEALRAKKPTIAAAVEARLRLGDEQTIAAELDAHPELKLWIYRSRALLLCLRALSRLVLVTGAAVELAYGHRTDVVRFGFAAAAAAAMTMAMLLVLELAILQRSIEGVHGIEVVPLPHLAADTAGAPIVPVVPPAGEPEEALAREKPAKLGEPNEQPGRVYVANTESLRIQISVEAPPPIGAPEAELEFTGFRLTDGEYLPIVKVAPVFPVLAASRGLEGYVVLEYTITPTGSVQDVVVVESSNGIFEESAIHAVSRFKYKPRIVEGQPVHVHRVRTKVNFKFEA
jgi:protein TonB